MDIHIEPDIRKAYTLPSEFYRSEWYAKRYILRIHIFIPKAFGSG